MQVLGVFIDGGSCLGAAIAFPVVELKRINAEFAGDAFERNPVVDLFRCVIAHIFNCSPAGRTPLGQRCWSFGWKHGSRRRTREACGFAELFAVNG